MKIVEISLHNFSLPLLRPFTVRHESIKNREGMVVCLLTDTGVIGLGEASPLPGFSQEPLKKAEHQLKLLAKEWEGRIVPADAHGAVTWLARNFDEEICPSVRFALESAVLMALARLKETSICALIQPASGKAVHSAGLLQGSLTEVIDQARKLKIQGFSTFKLKVGSRNIALDVRKVEEVKHVLGPQARLRLDANRAWRFDEALLFAQNIGKNQVEFIEEPTPEIGKWETLFKRTDIPLAADESQEIVSCDELFAINGLSTFVVKPTVRGGVTGMLDLLKRAHAAGRKVLVSSSFESGIGQVMLANLAALTGEAAGLGSINWFAQDTLTKPVTTPSGLIPPIRLSLGVDDLHNTWRHRWKLL